MVAVWDKVSDTQKLLGLISLGVLLRLLLHTGIGSADDLSIANAAIRLLEEGAHVPDGHYDARLMLIYPQALIFAIFGTGAWQMSVLPLFASALGGLFTFLLADRFFGRSPAYWALFTAIIFPLDVFYATRLMPDALLGGLLAGAIYFAVRSLDAGAQSRGWAIAAGVMWGVAYLVKIEAAFLLFPMVYLLCFWRGFYLSQGLWVAGACAFFVVGESLIYFLQTGKILYRLTIIAETAPMVTNADYRANELWVFPKAWFITFYEFSLHYYLLFAALLWAGIRKVKGTGLFCVWAIAFLIWVQFGTNPFAEEIRFKSHLTRYCLMLAVPVNILIGVFISRLPVTFRKAGASIWLAGSVFLMLFNTLSAERDVASKQLFEEALPGLDGPVYMDSGSYSIASYLALSLDDPPKLLRFQVHDFQQGITRIVPLDAIDGYVLFNRAFVDYRSNRYFMEGYTLAELEQHCNLVREVSNPQPAAAYAAARVLSALFSYMPVTFLREKITHTVGDILEGQDATLWKCGRE